MNLNGKTYEPHDGSWLPAHITAQAAAWHCAHNFEFEIDLSTAKCRQEWDRPESITIKLMAEMSEPAMEQGSTVLTAIPRTSNRKLAWIFVLDFRTP